MKRKGKRSGTSAPRKGVTRRKTLQGVPRGRGRRSMPVGGRQF